MRALCRGLPLINPHCSPLVFARVVSIYCIYTMNKNNLFLILSVAILYVIDQITKWLIVFNYQEPSLVSGIDRTEVVSDFSLFHFDIVRVHNQGVAFGMGDGTAWAPFVFLAVQIAALIALIIFFKKGFFHSSLLKTAWVCIMSGVLGNMTDRLLQGFFLKGADTLSLIENFKNGYVVDFLDFSFPWIETEQGIYHFAVFNVADSCVCIAAGLFIIASFFEPSDKKEEKTEA